MVNRSLAVLLLALVLAGAAPVETEAPIPQETIWTERRFEASPHAVQAALSAVMKQAGLAVDPDAAAAQPQEVVTVWHRFYLEDFGPSVAHDTPTITRAYPYVSPSRLRQGHYRLRARVVRGDDGTLLALKAELLADAYNVVEFEQQEVERFSNGVIEYVFYARVEQAFGPIPARN